MAAAETPAALANRVDTLIMVAECDRTVRRFRLPPPPGRRARLRGHDRRLSARRKFADSVGRRPSPSFGVARVPATRDSLAAQMR